MAIRKIRQDGDEVLRKKSKTVDEITPKIKELIEDMIDTMYEADGVGLAAPQVGILKRIFVVDIGEGPVVFINPEILETGGSQTGDEGCLSIPGYYAPVCRPNYVKVKFFDQNMEEHILEADDFFARAILHENDHLNGVLFKDRVDKDVKLEKIED
ncbi:MAG: peptide deformylase [Proteocatella sp.]